MNNLGWHSIIFTTIFLLMAIGLITLLFSRSTYARIKAIPYAFVYGIGIVVWLASLVYIRFVADTFLAHRFSFTAAYVFILGMLGLALTFPNSSLGKRTKRLLTLDMAIGSVFIVLVFFTNIVLTAANFTDAKAHPIGPLGKIYLFMLAGHLAFAVAIFIRRYLQEVRNRLYFNYIVLAFTLLFIIAITTNLILPLAGVVTFSLFGPLSALLPFVAVVYALGITDINDVSYVISQIAQLSARLAVMAGLLLVGLALHRIFGMGYYSAPWLIAIGTITAAGVMCFYLFGSAFDTYIENTIAYSRLSPDQARARLVLGLSGAIELERNATLILKLVKKTIGVRAAGIALLAKDGVFWSSGDFAMPRQEMVEAIQAVNVLASRRANGNELINLRMLSGPVQQALEHHGVYAVKRIRTESGIEGLYLLGEKFTQEIFTKQDATLMDAITEISDLSIERALFYSQIQSFNETLQGRVDTATKRLRNANKRLKTLDSMKDDFISMASHQLRSPATSVHEAIQMLTQDYLPQEERAKIIELAEASSERLVGVITDMLSIARIQAGHFMLEKTHVNMAELVNRAMLEASGLAKQKRITFIFNSPKEAIEFRADRAKLNEIMSNYIENAIKYSKEDSSVTIMLRSEDGKVVFEVRDEGIGVPVEERKDLFQKFYRATNARKEQPNGNGIGLFVVKIVAEAHGGAAYFKPLKAGSLFGFWLPL